MLSTALAAYTQFKSTDVLFQKVHEMMTGKRLNAANREHHMSCPKRVANSQVIKICCRKQHSTNYAHEDSI